MSPAATLVLKDLLPIKREKSVLLWIAASLANVFLIGSGSFWSYYLAIIPFYVIETYARAYDFRYGQDLYYLSLPVSRKDFVLARYLLVWTIVASTLVITAALGGILALAGTGAHPMTASFAGKVALAAALFSGLQLPVYFKFGYMKSRFINIVLFALLFGSIGALKALGDRGWTGGVIASRGWLAPLCFVAAALCTTLSAAISVFLFSKRDL